jgi:primosomal protein N' (replication factor Y)
MYTITVLPLSRSPVARDLSYYSAVSYPVGALLTVPVRGREQGAVVARVEEVRLNKATLRAADFTLRKVPRQTPRAYLSPEFVRAAHSTALRYATHAGAVITTYTPTALLTGSHAPLPNANTTRPRLRGFIVPRLYQGQSKARIEFYRASVREAFASHGSVMLVVPTIADAERVDRALSPGIDRYAYLLHSRLPAKEQRARIEELLGVTHPIVLVCTPGYLAIPRHDLTTIIIEREASSSYTTRERPYTDLRVVAHELAAELGGQLFLADLPLRIESVYRKEVGEYEEVVTGHHRTQFESKATLVSLRGEGREPKQPFYAIGRDLLTRMHEVLQRNGRIFLYVARRGLSPVTLCADCGTTVTCKECAASVVLHKGHDENYFLCHACGALRHARERCRTCQSWRLETFGVGTELVERELAVRLPEGHVQVLSSDTARTHTQARAIVRTYYDTPGSILIGTELALPYLTTTIDLTAVVSLDALLSIASYTVYERITGTVTRLRELAGGELLVQTRHPDLEVLRHALAGNFSGFYRTELRARKAMGYPPYTVLIKISTVGSEVEVAQRMRQAVADLMPHALIVYPRVLRAPGGKHISHGFLRIVRESWPEPDLVAKLRALPPVYVVHVDPESIL